MLHADYDSIVKLIDEQYSEKMNQMKAKRKSKIPYTGKISTHVPSGWCAHSTFSYRDPSDSLKICTMVNTVWKIL